VDACEGDRHERVAERLHVHRPRVDLARASRDEEAARCAPQWEDALVPLALLARPEEEAGRAEVETAERAQLHLERPLDAPDALRLLPTLGLLHRRSYSLKGVRRSLAPLLLVVALVLAWAAPAAAGSPPAVAARAVLVANGQTGEILYAQDADRRLPMASITKLMTAVVALDRARPTAIVTVGGPAQSIGESTIHLRTGDRLPVRDLLAAALVQSANDAAYALAAHVGRGSVSRFVELMNDKAVALGLDDTHYVRPDGLDVPRHYSSAEDTFELARVAMQDTVVRTLVRKRSLRIVGPRTIHTWNDLLGVYPGAIGVKTGHTDRAGWSEVAAARRDRVTIYAVILGSPSRSRRNRDLKRLLDWGFEQYGRFTLVEDGELYATVAVPFSNDRVELVAAGEVERIVRVGQGTRFVERVVAPVMVDLPVDRGEKLGEVAILAGGRLVARRPLLATRDVPEPGLGTRLGWYADRALDEAGDMLGTVLPG
jgi:D-alanyl-D-alanine carboxypeptidase (penicillin-binding protein 5/6)